MVAPEMYLWVSFLIEVRSKLNYERLQDSTVGVQELEKTNRIQLLWWWSRRAVISAGDQRLSAEHSRREAKVVVESGREMFPTRKAHTEIL